MTPTGILETILHASDLAAIEDFYGRVLGCTPYAKAEGRHIFYRCGDGIEAVGCQQLVDLPHLAGVVARNH